MARDVNAVATLKDFLGAIVGPVVAVFRDDEVGGKSRGDGKAKRGWGGRFDRLGVGLVLGDMNLADGALDQDTGGLVIEPVGDDALDEAVVLGVGEDFVAREDGFFNGKVGEVAKFAWGAFLFG